MPISIHAAIQVQTAGIAAAPPNHITSTTLLRYATVNDQLTCKPLHVAHVHCVLKAGTNSTVLRSS
jgi:hypothetical protein